MATTTRSLSSAVPAPSPVSAGSAGPSAAPARHRLRAVGRDEVVDVTDLLPPGATWLPAPQHTLPELPGRPPMIGYLVLVPADQQPPFLPVAVPDQVTTGSAGTTVPGGAVRAGEPADARADARDGGPEPVIRVDTAQRTAQVDGRELDLTYLEFELLAHLVAHPGRVHTRDHLVGTVWGYGHVGDGRTVDVHIARLRRKLGAEHRDAIQTVRRVGYKYTAPASR